MIKKKINKFYYYVMVFQALDFLFLYLALLFSSLIFAQKIINQFQFIAVSYKKQESIPRLDNYKVSVLNFFSFHSLLSFLLFRSLIKNKLLIVTNFKLNSKTFKCFISSKNQHLLNNCKSRKL